MATSKKTYGGSPAPGTAGQPRTQGAANPQGWADPGAQQVNLDWRGIPGAIWAASPFARLMNMGSASVNGTASRGGPGMGQPVGPTYGNPQQGEDYWLQQYDEFLRYLSQPVDMNDPFVRQTLNDVSSIISRQAQDRGIQGGLSLGASEAGMQQALTSLNQQRQQAYGGALANRAALERDMSRENYERQREVAMQQAQDRQGIGQTIGGILGGAGGLGVGIGASLLTGGAAAPAIPGLVAGGSQIGAGIGGGIGYGGGPGFQPYTYGQGATTGRGVYQPRRLSSYGGGF